MIVIGSCKSCGFNTIKSTLCDIDKVLSGMGKNFYLNDIYYLDKNFNISKFKSLVRYKDILIKKLFDESYTGFNTELIISKAKQYIHGM